MKNYSYMMCENGNLAVDDTLLVKGAPATAGSRMLDGFVPLFSAEAVIRLEQAGYTVSGKTPVGEFGLDLVGEFSHNNTAAEGETLCGAAATLVKNGDVELALGVDMTGAPRRAAALAGVDFLKPTYGTVSRYGVISCAASGEQVGVYAANVDGIAKAMGIIAGHDQKDGTSLPEASYDYHTDLAVAGKRVALVKDLLDTADDITKATVLAYADALRAAGVVVEEISGTCFRIANTAWQILMTAETCNNVSRYDGVKYGHRADTYKNIDELYVNSRTEGFNFLTKATVLYGSDMLSKSRYADCYDKSLRVRRVYDDAFKALFAQFDALLMPVCGKATYQTYAIADAFMTVYNESVFTAAANLIGTPALVSGGVQLMGDRFAESTLLSLAGAVERTGE